MKKELLVASALVSTLGMAGIAEAASATMSGHHKVGVTGTDLDSSSSNTRASDQQSTFIVSISETTDSGIKISTGFDLAEESSGSATHDPSGVTLTFTDGSKLDLVEAGTASASHAVAVPGAGGEQGISATTVNNAPTATTMGAASTAVGFEYHTAADAFGVEGLKASVSFASNDTALVTQTTQTASVETTYSVGVTYVTTAGDSTVTVGAGMLSASNNNSKTTEENETMQIGLTAVTGDLTVGVGYASGTYITTAGDLVQVDGDFTSAGASYVSGDITFAVGVTSAEGKDEAYGTAFSSASDARDTVGASIAYAVASGVTATLGYTDIDDKDEGAASTNTSGSSWYVGATVSF
jgi:hypothetical protein